MSPPPLCARTTHREAVLPKLHLDEDYPCSLVGNWNTWYGEQDQAGELPTPQHRWLPSTPPAQWCPGGSFSVQSSWLSPLLISVMAPSALGVAHEALEPFLALPRVSSHHIFLLTASSHPGLLSVLQVDRLSL